MKNGNIMGFDKGFIRDLKVLFRDTNIDEVEIKEGEDHYIKISRKKDTPKGEQIHYFGQPMQGQHFQAVNDMQPETTGMSTQTVIENDKYSDETKYHKILSPIVGTFYHAPTPESPAYVKIGDSVSADSTVCIVEAMKVMNEIKAETKGKVIEILKNNEDAILAGDVLFVIEKI